MPDTLPPALDAPIEQLETPNGPLKFYVAGRGAPVLLLHSINAAGSAYEVKPLFDRLCARFRVYALDLPGFGLSPRTDQEYSISLYVDAIQAMLSEILEREQQASCHVLALSLTAEFAARVARDRPQSVSSLAMVTPTGFSRGANDLRDAEGTTREIRLISAITKRRSIGRFLFRRLSRPAVIRYFLKKTFGGEHYDEGLADYDERTTQQPGAEFAPLAFLSGRLFASDIRSVYESLQVPVWLAHGTLGDFRDFSEADWTEERAHWQRSSYATGALPHFEVPDRFHDDYVRFLEENT